MPEQAIPLAGYMGWPNDPAGRDAAMRVLGKSLDGSRILPSGLQRIQQGWVRVADVLHKYCDLLDGKHQGRRGGPA